MRQSKLTDEEKAQHLPRLVSDGVSQPRWRVRLPPFWPYGRCKRPSHVATGRVVSVTRVCLSLWPRVMRVCFVVVGEVQWRC